MISRGRGPIGLLPITIMPPEALCQIPKCRTWFYNVAIDYKTIANRPASYGNKANVLQLIKQFFFWRQNL